MIPRYVVITTYERPDICRDAIASCTAEADTILVIDNGRNELMPNPSEERTYEPYYVLRDDTQPVNLSNLWNQGLQWCEDDAKKMGAAEWDVAILNDDVILPEFWLTNLQSEYRRTSAVACCTGPQHWLHTLPGPVPIPLRMTGWAFMVKGESGIRADEQFQWWYGDSDLDWRARTMGGMLMFPGPIPQNRFPNGYTTGDRHARAATDAQLFQEKWQRPAW